MDEWGVWRFGRSIQGVSVLPIFVEEGVEELWAKPTCGVSRSVFSIKLEYERVDTSSKVGVGIILLRFHPGKSRPRAKLDENRFFSGGAAGYCRLLEWSEKAEDDEVAKQLGSLGWIIEPLSSFQVMERR